MALTKEGKLALSSAMEDTKQTMEDETNEEEWIQSMAIRDLSQPDTLNELQIAELTPWFRNLSISERGRIENAVSEMKKKLWTYAKEQQSREAHGLIGKGVEVQREIDRLTPWYNNLSQEERTDLDKRINTGLDHLIHDFSH
jgi:hypothetical protein